MNYNPGYLLGERYLLKQHIGSGSFGEVWMAHDTSADIDVAVKIYSSSQISDNADFKKEFSLTFDLHHTNLLHASYMGVDNNSGQTFIVMPYCPGGSISGNAGNMAESDLWKCIRDVAAGLAYLHGRNIVHQDIKPDNILKLKDGSYVITDFGISTELRQTIMKNSSTMSGAVSYMGPERFEPGYLPVKSSDIWSIGVTIYELATGELPYFGEGGKMAAAGSPLPELPNNFSDDLNNLMHKCLQSNTWDRPQASEIAEIAANAVKSAKKSSVRHTIRKVEELKNFNTAVKSDSSNTTIPVGTVEKPFQSDSKVNDGGKRFFESKRLRVFAAAGIATIAIAVIGSIVYANNQTRTEKVKLNNETISKINDNCINAKVARTKGLLKEEGYYKHFLKAYLLLKQADSLSETIDRTVQCEVPNYNELKQLVSQDLDSAYIQLINKVMLLKSLDEEELASQFKKSAEEILFVTTPR